MAFRRNVAIVVAALLLCACSTLNVDGRQMLGSAIGSSNGTEVAYDKQCFALQQQCLQKQGHFEEWLTSEGKPGCSCKQ
jgi:hypothetical protein